VKQSLLSFLLILSFFVDAQDSASVLQPTERNYTGRKWLAGGLTAAGYGGSFPFPEPGLVQRLSQGSFPHL
jgi:hypothetical protein